MRVISEIPQLSWVTLGAQVRSEMTIVTPELASRWLMERPYSGQRRKRDEHVKFLAEEMLRGNFLSGTQVVFAFLPSAPTVLYCIDGQHTLSAIALCGQSQLLRVLYMPCANDTEIAKAYGRIDINIKRTVNDMFSAMSLGSGLGFTSTQLNQMGAAAKLISSGFKGTSIRRLHNDDLVAWISDYAPAGHEYYQEVAGMPKEMKKSMQRAATLSVALITYRFSKRAFGEKIGDFWRGVCFDDGINIGDPRKAAHRHLVTASMAGGGYTSGRRTVSAAYSARYLANCFNAFIEGRSFQQTKVPDDALPIRLAGSPFTGKA